MTPAFLDVAGIQFGYIKSSKFAMEILANYRSPYFCNSIKTLDRSTLCTAPVQWENILFLIFHGKTKWGKDWLVITNDFLLWQDYSSLIPSLSNQYNVFVDKKSLELQNPKRIGMYNVFVDSLSWWVKAVKSLVQFQINRLIMSINTKAAAVFKDSDVAETHDPMKCIHSPSNVL
jgi:hypothetical protein